MIDRIEKERKAVISGLFDTKTVKSVWPTWQKEITSILGQTPTVEELIKLGQSLSRIFFSTNKKSTQTNMSTAEGTPESQTGRGQSDVSAGGALWEALVCWYLNLCLQGTNCVVYKKSSMLPAPVRALITVMYGSVQTNTEADLVAITFPHHSMEEAPQNYFDPKVDELSSLIDRRIGETEVCIVQCKTNWNDNAQIPMLWDMIYSSARAGSTFSPQISVGTKGYSLRQLKSFKYSFVTVPTTKPERIKQNSTCVLRVKALSGGNYWGLPAIEGVASSIPDMLDRVFATAINSTPSSWRIQVSENLKNALDKETYFQLHTL